jgi:hypothetical protein
MMARPGGFASLRQDMRDDRVKDTKHKQTGHRPDCMTHAGRVTFFIIDD